MPRHKVDSAKLSQVLEYMDGPQAVLLELGPDSKIVAVATAEAVNDQDFLGAEISYEQWERYRRGLVDLRFLFTFPKWKRWYKFNLHHQSNGQIRLQALDRSKDIDDHEFPDAGFFSYDHSEPILEERSKELATQKYNTDGIWDLPDFSRFYKKLIDIYAFFLSLKKFTEDATPVDLKRRIRLSFSDQPLRGGSSYKNMYGGLLSVQQLQDRLSVGRLYYGSPGEVNVRGRLDVFTEISVSLSVFESNYDGIKSQYDDIYDYLSKNKLLRHDPERFDDTGVISKDILTKSNSFAKSLNIDNPDLIYELAGRNSLVYTKIILSHYRRMDKYFMFFAEGRIKQPVTIPGGNSR